MEFLVGVGLLAASIYYFMNGAPLLGGALGGVGVVAFGGGLFRRRKKRDATK